MYLGFFKQQSLPLIRTRVRSDVRELHQTHCDVTHEGTNRSKLTNSTSPECMFRGNMTPLVPPSSPLTPGADPSFAVDGRHINCDGASRSPSVNINILWNHSYFAGQIMS